MKIYVKMPTTKVSTKYKSIINILLPYDSINYIRFKGSGFNLLNREVPLQN
ncbi:hypothetical protein CLOSBL3_12462 [Clostridiaceae bacterium BL-3]|nr:hypothetical protein CLOSBL3_12462 [Clostridiaceae bacterium BL-3]